jgi:hypothetical protein
MIQDMEKEQKQVLTELASFAESITSIIDGAESEAPKEISDQYNNNNNNTHTFPVSNTNPANYQVSSNNNNGIPSTNYEQLGNFSELLQAYNLVGRQ